MNDLTFKYSEILLDMEWTLIFCHFCMETISPLASGFEKKYKGSPNLRFRKALLSTYKGSHTSYSHIHYLVSLCQWQLQCLSSISYLVFGQLLQINLLFWCSINPFKNRHT